MHIAMISEHASPLGTGEQDAHLADLSVALAELGHDVRVYTRRQDQHVAEVVVTRSGVHVVHIAAGPPRPIPSDLLLPYMGEFARILGEQWRGGWVPDVAHAHFWTSGLAAVTAARQHNIPVVQSFHELGGGEQAEHGPSRTGYERALGRAVDRVVAQTQDEVQGLVRIGVPRARLTVVPSGVDSDHFTPDGPAVQRDPERPRILSVGKLVEHKGSGGYGDVIQAMRYVPDAEVVVIGGPAPEHLSTDPGARRLRSMAEQFKVADRFRLVGAVPHRDLPSWYRSADLLIANGWEEQAALEAMACGVPIVGQAGGALTEAVVDGLTGDLVPDRDPRALGGALRRLVNDKVRRFTYATAALDRARQAYSWKRVAAQIGSVYTSLRRTPATVAEDGA